MTFTVAKANQYIAENQDQVNPLYKPQAHFSAPIGWINDPNGFVKFGGDYHLFYQYFPYGTEWGPMHWGHAKSKDGLTWEHLPVALAPDQTYDKDGCFSGSALVKDGKLWLMYTGHIVQEDGSIRQVQNMAYSEDGIHFEKLAQNPVLDEKDLPEGISPSDFRDPKIFEKDGRYYAVVAAKQIDETGCIVLVGSDDLVDWQFESIFLSGQPDLGIMWECPDYFNLNGQDCLLMSPMRVPRDGYSHHNLNSTFLMKGTVDWDKKTFVLETVEELDYGHDFYAPQTLQDEEGKRVMIAWQHTWGRRNITHELGHKWAMSMTIPRGLELKDGVLYQTSLAQERGALDLDKALVEAGVLKVRIDHNQAFQLQLGSADDHVLLSYDPEIKTLALNRKGLKESLLGEEVEPVWERRVSIREETLERVDVIFDVNSLEIFVNGGSRTLSSNLYFQEDTQVLAQVVSGSVHVEACKI